MKITEEMHRTWISYSIEYAKGNMDRKTAIEAAYKAAPGNQGSISDYLQHIKCAVEGRRYTRTNSVIGTTLSFEAIEKEFGLKGLKNALSAFRQHIEYYEDRTQTRSLAKHKLLEQYEKKIR